MKIAMFALRRPDDTAIRQFLANRAEDFFSYPEVGVSRTGVPQGYNVDHSRILLGHGEETFERAKAAIGNWQMFDIGWVELIHPLEPIRAGMNVAILAHTMGLYSLSSCRVVYVLDEAIPIRRFGFGYGTLTHHVERGEERFSVEWLADDSVWYDILAFSKPRHILARTGYLASRYYQGRFAVDSMAAMKRAIAGLT
jgi:uncharacterized protein (UPF0548 family)